MRNIFLYKRKSRFSIHLVSSKARGKNRDHPPKLWNQRFTNDSIDIWQFIRKMSLFTIVGSAPTRAENVKSIRKQFTFHYEGKWSSFSARKGHLSSSWTSRSSNSYMFLLVRSYGTQHCKARCATLSRCQRLIESMRDRYGEWERDREGKGAGLGIRSPRGGKWVFRLRKMLAAAEWRRTTRRWGGIR